MENSKTPVTILQELLMKRHMVPTYNLVLNGVGSHEPLFKYEVSASGKTAIGSGKSKKEAKHNAAQQLLQVMKEYDSTVSSLHDEVASPYEGILKENAVGDLQDFCVMNQLKLPEYKLIRDEGLPHAKIFSWTCTVSSFCTEATARTKKNAKHLAAQDMLLKLKEVLGDEAITDTAKSTPYSSPTHQQDDYMDSAVDEAIRKFPRHLRKATRPGKLGLNMSDVCFALTDRNLPDLMYLDAIKDQDSTWFDSQDKDGYQNIFTKIVDEMQCEYDLLRMDSSQESKRVVALVVDSMPPWTFIGTGNSLLEASNAVYEDAVKFMVKMRI